MNNFLLLQSVSFSATLLHSYSCILSSLALSLRPLEGLSLIGGYTGDGVGDGQFAK